MKVARLNKPGRYGDGLGLWLQVSTFGTKAWLFRYQLNGRPRQMGLGALHTISLAEARETATACRKLLLDGVDPIEAKRERRVGDAIERARSVTFRAAAEKYIAANERHWKNEKHRAQWGATLATYAYGTIGDLPVGEIDKALVIRVLEPIWETKRETANRLRGRIETVLNWAAAHGYRKEGDNPARWRGHLEHALAKKRPDVRHHSALPYRELPAFMASLRVRQGISPKCLEFVILTAARTGEAIAARRTEFDLKERLWTVPADRMKSGREHRVPLSDRAIAILKELPSEGEFAFTGARAGKPLSNMALLKTLRDMGRGNLTTHGFRSTFRDWAAEQTSYPHEVAEMALAHTISDKVEAAYRRGDLFEKRRRLAAEWERYCSVGGSGGKVVSIKAARR
jgi:integrase